MEQKRLKRFWARARMVLTGLCFLTWLIDYAVMETLPAGASLTLCALGCLFLLAMVVVTRRHLRCTCCGKGIANGYWNPSKKTVYCPHCGKPFLFDDDPPDKAETTTKEEP